MTRPDISMLPMQGDLYNRRCPARQIVDHVAGLWGGLILKALNNRGKLRFGELRRQLDGISDKMLAKSLRTLERDGFVTRDCFPVVLPRVEYLLTPIGLECASHVLAVCDFVETHVHSIVNQQIAYDASPATAPWQTPRS